MVIDNFTGENRFLSNFHPAEIVYHGKIYPTVEHAYQAAKTLNPDEQQRIRECKTPGEAKKLGQSVTIRPDWEDCKAMIMYLLLYKKFSDSDLKAELMATEDEDLIEGNYWHDNYWGICFCSRCSAANKKMEAKNMLGKLLMNIRMSIKIGVIKEEKCSSDSQAQEKG